MRYGRLNKVSLQSELVVKTCVVKEETRPHKLLVEKWALEQARQQMIRTPEVVSYNHDDHGSEVLTMRRVPGNSLTRTISRESVKAFMRIGEQLNLRRCDYSGYGWIDPSTMTGIYPTWRQFLFDYAKMYCSQLIKHFVITPDDRNRLLDEIACCEALENAPSALVHRDIKPGNIIWGEDGAFLIDWENVMLGDPYYDLCVYRSRFGTGRRWDVLVANAETVIPAIKRIYLSVALIGLIDFCITYKYGVKAKSEQLRNLISQL